MKALRTLLKTNESYTPLIARLALGLAMFPHGAQKKAFEEYQRGLMGEIPKVAA